MKTRFLTFIMALIMVILCGCSEAITTSSPSDIGVISEDICETSDISINSEDTHQNYDFWETDDELRLIVSITTENNSSSQEDYPHPTTQKLPPMQQKSITELRKGIISYFSENYEIDLNEKISKQKILLYSEEASNDGITLGYVNTRDPDTLYLHESLLTINSVLFDNTYVHETLHQLGIHNDEDSMLMEGITDAFADLIVTSMGRTSYPTPLYSDTRTLAYQIISVDKELPHLLFEKNNFSIRQRINQKLKDIPQPYKKTNSPGDTLVLLECALYQNQSGNPTNIEPYFLAFQAQEIVNTYCKTFHPDTSTINDIRQLYLIEDFENLEIEPSPDGYSIIKKTD